MPQIALAAAATASTVITAGGVGATSFLGLTGFAAVGAQFAVRAALGYALNALSSSSTRGRPTTRGYQSVNQLGTALPHQVIYGETRIGGAVFYQTITGADDEELHRCIAFAGHEIESFEAIYVDGVEVTIDPVTHFVTSPTALAFSQIRIKQYLGTDTQEADPDLVSEVSEWTENHRAQGVAYLYVRFDRQSATSFTNGVPTITAKIRGKKVEDPRTGTTAWSANPALCIRDYLLSDYGLSESTADLNDTLFEEAADACDASVAGAPIYTLNGAFTLDADPEDIIRNLLSSMGGTFWNYSGQWAILAAEYQTPTLTLTEADLRGPMEIATRHSRRDNFNVVRGQFKGAETEYQPDDFEEVTSGAWLSEDNGIPAKTELNLLFTDTEVMAQRIAKTFLRRNRKQITVSAPFGLRAMDLKVGDNVMLTIDHLEWSQKVFEVVDWRLGVKDLDIQVNLLLREMDEEVFTGIIRDVRDESGVTVEDESGNTVEAIVA